MSTVCVDQDHQIIGETRVLDVGVFAVACGLLGSLEHTVHLIEVDITEQWGDHSALRDATATVRFQHDLQQVHHVIIVDSLRYLGQQQIVLNVVKVAAQIKIYDARLALNDRLGYAVNCFMSCLLRTIPKRSRLEVSLSPSPSNSRRSSWTSRKLVEARRLSSVAKRDRNCQLAGGSGPGGLSLATRSTNTWANSGSYC